MLENEIIRIQKNTIMYYFWKNVFLSDSNVRYTFSFGGRVCGVSQELSDFNFLMRVKKILRTLVVLLFSISAVCAQDRVVSGKISSADEPRGFPGATVLIRGTTQGVVTDTDGSYTLIIPSSVQQPVLIISSLGYVTQEVPVKNRSNVDVLLVVATGKLDEVVISSGYRGAQQKRSVTGSVAAISSKEIEGQEITNIGQALEGKIAGVRVITTTGIPGATPRIYIRGLGSLTSSSYPLVVLDGAPFGFATYMIPPHDIESISVLKDASSAVLYGSRASNGVLLYRTKRATRNVKPSINFYWQTGVTSRATPEYDLPTSGEYLQILREALYNDAVVALMNSDHRAVFSKINGDRRPDISKLTSSQREVLYESANRMANKDLFNFFNYNPYGTVNLDQNGQAIIDEVTNQPAYVSPFKDDGTLTERAQSNGLKWDTDWVSLLSNRNPVNRSVGLNVRGGSRGFRYYTSLGYLYQDGTVIRSSLERLSLRVNIETDPTSWATLGMLNSFVYVKAHNHDQSGAGYRNPVRWGRMMPSAVPVYARDAAGNIVKNEDGTSKYDLGIGNMPVNSGRIFPNYNIYTTLIEDDYLQKDYAIFAFPYLEVRPLSGFTLKTQLSLFLRFGNYYIRWDPESGDGNLYGGIIYRSRDFTGEGNLANTLNYQRYFGAQSVDVTLGTELYGNLYNFTNVTKAKTARATLNTAAELLQINGSTTEERIARAFGTVSYGLLNRYFVELAASRDALSRFSKESRASTFYSGGLAWVLSDEPFFVKNNTVSSLRLRASYGLLGNSQVGSLFPGLSRLSVSSGYAEGDLVGAYRDNLYDAGVTWEKAVILNVGTDIAFFKNRLSLELEYFERNTRDLVSGRPLAPSLGYTSYSTNVARIKNSGVDVTLSSINIRTKKFTWRSTLTLSNVKNEILSLPIDDYSVSSILRWKIGGSRYDVYLPEWAGVEPITGLPQWWTYAKTKEEVDGSGRKVKVVELDENDKVVDGIKRVKTFSYNEAREPHNLLYGGSMLPELVGGLGTSVEFYGVSISIGFSFELGGQAYVDDYASLVHGFSRGEAYQTSADHLSDRVWHQPGDNADFPVLTTTPSRGAWVSSRFLYDNSYAKIRNVSIGYTLPDRLVEKTKFVSGMYIYLQANNLYAFSLAARKPPVGYDPQVGGISGIAVGNSSAAYRLVTTGLRFSF